MKLLLVTNDFPPRVGGIQVYLENIYRRLAERHDVVVFAPAHPGDVSYDAAQPFEVVRHPGRIYWPTPQIRRRAAALARSADVVAFGAMLPMNQIAPSLGRPYVLHTHGLEVAAARLPGFASFIGALGARSSLVTVVSEYCRRYIEGAMRRAPRVEMLKTGVDLETFHPSADGAEVRKRFGLEGRPVVACVSRLVARKGQDRLIQAWPAVKRSVPDAALLIAGGGPYRRRLQRLAADAGVARDVVFAGETPWRDLPPTYAAGDVFAMPCRSRYANLEVEGLGLVYLEAQACARPAITGDSGGAPEAVLAGETGLVVGGDDVPGLARAVVDLLGNPERAAGMGRAGRSFVERDHDWAAVVARYEAMLGRI